VTDRVKDFLMSHGRTHNVALLIAACSFAKCAWVCSDATVIAAVGGTFATVFTANSWAGKPQATDATPKP
jgi:hypothetical protein